MIELIIGTYGTLCWLLFKKFKVIPTNTYTVATALLIGVGILSSLGLILIMFHPSSDNGRIIAITTPIVPQVRGVVIEVPVKGNTPLKKGDVLFKIDPEKFQIEVDRMEAVLAQAKIRAAQLQQKLRAAVAATAQAQADLLASESSFDRQAREALEQARANVSRIASERELARKDEVRFRQLLRSGTIPKARYESVKQKLTGLNAQLRQAGSAQRQAREKVKGGGSRITAAREKLSRAQAAEQEVRLDAEGGDDGVNPDVARVTAELARKKWELSQTVVRAPGPGFVTQVALRPGQMAVPFPLAPVMVFVQGDQHILAASFPQNVIAGIKPGLEAEMIFKAYPGRSFTATVSQVLPAIPEGQFTASGQLRGLPSGKAPGRIPVIFEYGDDVAALKLPAGSQATVAVYTEEFRFLVIVRRILLRIKSWENYIFIP